jgi:hypothetical protein
LWNSNGTNLVKLLSSFNSHRFYFMIIEILWILHLLNESAYPHYFFSYLYNQNTLLEFQLAQNLLKSVCNIAFHFIKFHDIIQIDLRTWKHFKQFISLRSTQYLWF